MVLILSILNAAAALLSAAFGAAALFRPRTHSSSEGDADPFFRRMYAARAIPFGLFVAVLPFLRHGSAVALVLSVAALIQLLDVGIGIQQKNARMPLGAGTAAVIHIVCGLAML